MIFQKRISRIGKIVSLNGNSNRIPNLFHISTRSIAVLHTNNKSTSNKKSLLKLESASDILSKLINAQTIQDSLTSSRKQGLLESTVSTLLSNVNKETLSNLDTLNLTISIISNKGLQSSERVIDAIFKDSRIPSSICNITDKASNLVFELKDEVIPTKYKSLTDNIRVYKAIWNPENKQKIITTIYAIDSFKIENENNDVLKSLIYESDSTIGIIKSNEIIQNKNFQEIIDIHRINEKPNFSLLVDISDSNINNNNQIKSIDELTSSIVKYEDTISNSSGNDKLSNKDGKKKIYAINLKSNDLTESLIERFSNDFLSELINNTVNLKLDNIIYIIKESLSNINENLEISNKYSLISAKSDILKSDMKNSEINIINSEMIYSKARILVSKIEASQKRLLRNFSSGDLEQLNYSTSNIKKELDTYFKSVPFYSLFYKSENIGIEVEEILSKQTLKDVEYRTVYSIGRLNENLYSLYQEIREFLVELANIEHIKTGNQNLTEESLNKFEISNKEKQIIKLIMELDSRSRIEADPFLLKNIIRDFQKSNLNYKDMNGLVIQNKIIKLASNQFFGQIGLGFLSVLGYHFGIPLNFIIPITISISTIGFSWMSLKWKTLQKTITGQITRNNLILSNDLKETYLQEFETIVNKPLENTIKEIDEIIINSNQGKNINKINDLERSVQDLSKRVVEELL